MIVSRRTILLSSSLSSAPNRQSEVSAAYPDQHERSLVRRETHQAALAPDRPEVGLADSLGCVERRAARTRRRHAHCAAQRDRRALRFLFAVSRPGSGGGDARPGARPGSHQYRPGHPDRPVPEVERSFGHRLARPLRPPGERGVRRAARRGLGHPPDHRGDQGPGEHAGVPRRDRGGPAPARRRRPHRERRRASDQGSHRACLVPAGNRRAVRHRGERSAPRPVRAVRRDVLRAGDAQGHEGLPAADRRHQRVHLR